MGFRQATFYMAELFRQATFYMAELFPQATFYLAELFRQITSHIELLHKTKTSCYWKHSKQKIRINFDLFLAIIFLLILE